MAEAPSAPAGMNGLAVSLLEAMRRVASQPKGIRFVELPDDVQSLLDATGVQSQSFDTLTPSGRFGLLVKLLGRFQN